MILGAIVFVPFWRAAGAHAYTHGNQLTVVNTFRTTSVDASEIVEFRLGPKQSPVFYAAAAAELRNRDEPTTFRIQAARLSSSRLNALGLLDQLNEWLAEACSPSLTAGGRLSSAKYHQKRVRKKTIE